MKTMRLFFFLSAITLFLVNAVDLPRDGDVIVLNAGNFDAATSEGEWLVEFFAPWCGHCQRLAPIYSKVATNLKGLYNVGKVDCTVETDLASRFEIRGYPTLYRIHEGKMYSYQSQRTEEAFEEFMKGGWKSAEAKQVPLNPNAPKEEKEEQKPLEANENNQGKTPKVAEVGEDAHDSHNENGKSGGGMVIFFLVVIMVGAFVFYVNYKPSGPKIHYGKD